VVVGVRVIVLRQPVNVYGLEWPAGEHRVADPFWAEVLAQVAQPADTAVQQAPEPAPAPARPRRPKKQEER